MFERPCQNQSGKRPWLGKSGQRVEIFQKGGAQQVLINRHLAARHLAISLPILRLCHKGRSSVIFVVLCMQCSERTAVIACLANCLTPLGSCPVVRLQGLCLSAAFCVRRCLAMHGFHVPWSPIIHRDAAAHSWLLDACAVLSSVLLAPGLVALLGHSAACALLALIPSMASGGTQNVVAIMRMRPMPPASGSCLLVLLSAFLRSSSSSCCQGFSSFDFPSRGHNMSQGDVYA